MILTGYVESNSCEAELYINMSGVHNLMNKIKKVVLIIVVARYVYYSLLPDIVDLINSYLSGGIRIS